MDSTATCFADSQVIAEWEESGFTERVYIGQCVLPRYCSMAEVITVLTLEGLFNSLLPCCL